jgi:hypothetical protein
VTGWRGLPGPYDSLYAGQGDRGGGLEVSRLRQGQTRPIQAGATGGGGGRVQSTAEPLTGFGGVGGPGPGAMIGLS